MDSFDVIIIGSGMGGLVCGDLLSREGYRVCIIEKNKQLGGCLQTYVRDKVIFDSGVHYLGGLDRGQNLYQIFKYMDLMDKLKLERQDKDVFDKIMIDGDDNEYPFAQGYENFIAKLLVYFPDEEQALRNYCEKIKEVCSKFPLYNLRANGSYSEKSGVLEISAKDFIDSITTNEKLRAVLAGNNALYAGQGDTTPFYVHALILNSYIESSWKCIDGGSQISKYIARNIRERGGVIYRDTPVVKIEADNEKVTHVVLKDGSIKKATYFISNMHPVNTLQMIESGLIKNVYRKRLNALANSVSSFTLNIIFKKDSYRYHKHNVYWHKEGRVWDATDYTEANWPLSYAVFMSAHSKSESYAESMTVLTYMRYEEVAQWQDTFNTVSDKMDRGTAYDAFKKAKAERLLDIIEKKFPGIRMHIQTYYSATPLSFRDYIGNDDGSLYGIAKDYKDPLKTLISPRTKIPNLYFTGQNLNLHGILGAAMSGLVTTCALIGNETIIEKIKDA